MLTALQKRMSIIMKLKEIKFLFMFMLSNLIFYIDTPFCKAVYTELQLNFIACLSSYLDELLPKPFKNCTSRSGRVSQPTQPTQPTQIV